MNTQDENKPSGKALVAVLRHRDRDILGIFSSEKKAHEILKLYGYKENDYDLLTYQIDDDY